LSIPQNIKKMSSLAIKQMIATLEEQLQAGHNVKSQLDNLYKQRDAEQKAVVDAALAVKHQAEIDQKKLDKKMKIKRYEPEVPVAPAGRTIKCCDCPTEFFFAQKEEELFTAEGMQPRKRCAPCLQAKKDKQPQPIELCCAGCKSTFIFGVGSQKHFATAGWAPPKRCAPCRETKKVAHAVTVTAATATETFIVGDVVIPLA
jgi:hypothetical protein